MIDRLEQLPKKLPLVARTARQSLRGRAASPNGDFWGNPANRMNVLLLLEFRFCERDLGGDLYGVSHPCFRNELLCGGNAA